MRKFWVLILFLTACHTGSQNYADTLQPWLGQSEERLFQSWGLPQNVFYITPSQKVLTYVQYSANSADGNNPYSAEIYYPAIDNTEWGVPTAPQNGPYYCKTLFTITGNTITDYSFNGDNCVED